jgi:hypothetical protein
MAAGDGGDWEELRAELLLSCKAALPLFVQGGSRVNILPYPKGLPGSCF